MTPDPFAELGAALMRSPYGRACRWCVDKLAVFLNRHGWLQ
jgi:hypothetical protein